VEPLDLIDEIYEAAVIPDLWLRTLDRLAKIAGGEGAFLFSADHKSTQFLSSPAIEPLFRARLSESWIDHNERDKRLRPILEPRFLTDFDAFSPEELETIPFYKNFLRVAGFGWCAGTAIRSPTTETMVFSIERLFEKGPVEPEAVATLDALRPHLARAAVLSAKIGLLRVRSRVLALEAVDIAAAVLSSSGEVIAANSLLEQCAPAITIRARDLLLFENPSTQTFFENLLAREGQDGAARSFPLRANGVNAPAVAHLMPLRGAGRDLFTGGRLLLYVTALSRRSPLPAALLQALFDLTPAEARVAHLIGGGHTVSEAARHLAVQGNTVRAQLKSIFAKTGARRQAELISIVATQFQPKG